MHVRPPTNYWLAVQALSSSQHWIRASEWRAQDPCLMHHIKLPCLVRHTFWTFLATAKRNYKVLPEKNLSSALSLPTWKQYCSWAIYSLLFAVVQLKTKGLSLDCALTPVPHENGQEWLLWALKGTLQHCFHLLGAQASCLSLWFLAKAAHATQSWCMALPWQALSECIIKNASTPG